MTAPTLTLTEARAADLLAEMAAEQPDRVVGDCQYATLGGSGPCCLVGHVLARAGWPVAALVKADRYAAASVAADLLPEYLPELFGGLDRRAAELLRRAQRAQDDGATWAAAAAEAFGTAVTS